MSADSAAPSPPSAELDASAPPAVSEPPDVSALELATAESDVGAPVDPSELVATWKESPSDKLTLVPSPERVVGASDVATASTVSSTLAESALDPLSAIAASGAA